MEYCLRNQLINVIPSTYLDSLQYTFTDMIHNTIPEIITFLKTSYCHLTDQELSDKEDWVKSTTFDTQQPVDVIFNKIKLS